VKRLTQVHLQISHYDVGGYSYCRVISENYASSSRLVAVN